MDILAIKLRLLIIFLFYCFLDTHFGDCLTGTRVGMSQAHISDFSRDVGLVRAVWMSKR